MIFPVVLSALLAVAALGFLLVGVRGLTRRAPMVFPAKRLIVLVVLCFLPGLAAPLALQLDRHFHLGSMPPVTFFPPVLYALILALLIRLLRGYTVVGADDRALAAGLRQALDRLGFPYEESLGRMRLTLQNADLAVHTQAGTGSAQIRMEPEDRPVLDQIAAALRDALAAGGAPPQRLVFAIFTGVGLLLLGIAIFIALQIG